MFFSFGIEIRGKCCYNIVYFRMGGYRMNLKNQRIWEIDVARGACIPGMILIHLIYDVVNLYGFIHWPYPTWYSLFKNNYGALFLLISGVSVTLGSRSARRGITVFLGGMIVSAVTVGMYLMGMAGRGLIIYFGVLHCLGTCMLLWLLFRKLSPRALLTLAIPLVLVGWWLRGESFNMPVLMPLGFTFPGFSSSDYFPLMPNLGYFLAGASFGKKFYAEKITRFPNVNTQNPVIRFFSWCGRNSLMIYLLHQPVLALGCELYAMIL